jgi:hypothetical protein
MEIANFLMRMKQVVKAKKNIYFVPRKENEEALLRLNLTLEIVWNELLKLTSANYKKGPEEDRNGSEGEVWVFLHPITGVEIYIKMKLFKIHEEDHLKVLSFHD